ncbi:hypothetical protein Vadar_024353 [Vaccinium darrowii]|uniref:Uncharacterized protein n=1 Tax=Vaccinium darrowii TaxID=229202 RepID=A0ACB7YP46_9ERIC|nr:hypothetical protein Vadar_024353 [Vaccinium darrowii]
MLRGRAKEEAREQTESTNETDEAAVTAKAEVDTTVVDVKEKIKKGCDASLILASPDGKAEKDHLDNLSLAGDGFDTVIKAKAAVDINPQCTTFHVLIYWLWRLLGISLPWRTILFSVELGRRNGTHGRISSTASVQHTSTQLGFRSAQHPVQLPWPYPNKHGCSFR